MLLCESLGGSEKATHTDLFASMSSVNKLSWLLYSTLSEAFGGDIFVSPSNGWISLLKGGLAEPVKPAHPYEAASVSLVFGAFAVFPGCKTSLSF